jgi:hypothetical protein
MHLLPVSLAPIADLCDKKTNARFGATSGVKITVDDKSQFTAVATDGRRLIRVIGTCDDPAPAPPNHNGYPSIAATESAPNGELGAVINAKDWQKAFSEAEKLTRKTHKPILRNVCAIFGKDVSTLAATDLERVSFHQPRNVDGRFPDFNFVFPKKAPTYSIDVDPYLLAEVLETVAKLGTSDDGKRVTLNFQQPDQPFTITTHRATPLDVTAVIVPLVGDTKKRKAAEPIDDDRTTAEHRAALENASRTIETLRAELTHAENMRDMLRQDLEATCETLCQISDTLRPLANVPGTIATTCYHLANDAIK